MLDVSCCTTGESRLWRQFALQGWHGSGAGNDTVRLYPQGKSRAAPLSSLPADNSASRAAFYLYSRYFFMSAPQLSIQSPAKPTAWSDRALAAATNPVHTVPPGRSSDHPFICCNGLTSFSISVQLWLNWKTYFYADEPSWRKRSHCEEKIQFCYTSTMAVRGAWGRGRTCASCRKQLKQAGGN